MCYEMQIEWMRYVQSLGGKPFFVFLNFFDTTPFYILLILFVYCCTPFRAWLRFLLITLLSNLALRGAKYYFHLPRPCTLDPSVGLIPCSGYAFPSGGSMSASLFGLLLFYHVKHPAVRVVALLYPILIGFSRFYLGMHFIQDILGGFLLGLLLFLLYLIIPRTKYL